MDWVKLDAAQDRDGLHRKILYPDTRPNILSSIAKEKWAEGVDKKPTPNRPWTDYTLIRIEKHQNAVLVNGDKILTSCGKPGDYILQGEEDVSKAKVYFVRTCTISSKVYEPHTPIVYKAIHKELGVERDIRIQTAFYFTYRVKNPKAFMRSLVEEKEKNQTHQATEAQLHGIFSVCLPDVLAQLSAEGVPYTEIVAQSKRLTQLMAEKLSVAWKNSRGIELKNFAIVKSDPNQSDEEAFLQQCHQAQSTDPVSSEEFSEDFSEFLKSLGAVAGEAIQSFQTEMTSLFGDFAEALENELQTDPEDSEDDFDLALDSLLNLGGMRVMGRWECCELKQAITFELLEAFLQINGREVWRGDWQEKKQEDGVAVITCPTADSLGGYAYFNLVTDSEDQTEYLEGVLSDTGTEKQFVRFQKSETK